VSKCLEAKHDTLFLTYQVYVNWTVSESAEVTGILRTPACM